MNQIYIGIYVFIALCCINGNNAGKTSRPTVIALRKSIPEVQRAAYFAVFELQSQTGKYITMRNIDDAKKEVSIFPSPVDHDFAMIVLSVELPINLAYCDHLSEQKGHPFMTSTPRGRVGSGSGHVTHADEESGPAPCSLEAHTEN